VVQTDEVILSRILFQSFILLLPSLELKRGVGGELESKTGVWEREAIISGKLFQS